MPAHPRYQNAEGRTPSWAIDDPRNKGWFSRRNKSGEKYQLYRLKKEEREKKRIETIVNNKRARQERTDEEQLALLDERLGKGKGATKERARLIKRISEKIEERDKAKKAKKDDNNPSKKDKPRGKRKRRGRKRKKES